MNAKGALHLTLEDTKAECARLMTKPLSQQRPVVRQRAESVSQPLARINPPSPLDSQKLYSLRQAMDVISLDSASFQSVAIKMIKRGCVPVKKSQLH